MIYLSQYQTYFRNKLRKGRKKYIKRGVRRKSRSKHRPVTSHSIRKAAMASNNCMLTGQLWNRSSNGFSWYQIKRNLRHGTNWAKVAGDRKSAVP